MVNQGPDRRRQATPGRKDDVKDTLLAAPIREHMDELAIAERLPADMAPRDLETLVCARGAKLSLKSLSKRLEISPARKPRINLRPTGDGKACEDPRSRRIWRSQRRQCDFTG